MLISYRIPERQLVAHQGYADFAGSTRPAQIGIALVLWKVNSRKRLKMDAGCIFWGIIWFIILWFLGWPISIFLGAFYGFLLPLFTLIGLDDISEVLLKGVQIGKVCAENVRNGKSLC